MLQFDPSSGVVSQRRLLEEITQRTNVTVSEDMRAWLATLIEEVKRDYRESMKRAILGYLLMVRWLCCAVVGTEAYLLVDAGQTRAKTVAHCRCACRPLLQNNPRPRAL